MRKFIFLSLGMAFMMLMASCSDGQKSKVRDDRRSEYIRPASMYYSHEDTVNIQNLVGDYLEHFKAKDFQYCADMIYIVRNDSVFPLTAEQKQSYLRAMDRLHVYDAKQQTLLLRSDKNNEVRLLVQIRENGSLEEEKGVTTVALNPVVFEGQWYLTALDKYAEGVKDVYRNE